MPLTTFSDGDSAFVGVDERKDPGQLEPGIVARAINHEFTNEDAEPRKAFQERQPLSSLGFSFPFSFDLNFIEPVGHGKTYGAIGFTNQYGEQFFLLALKRYALLIHESGSRTPVRYPTDHELEDKVELIQANGEVWMSRGNMLTAWRWNGIEGGDFIETPQEDDLPEGVIPFPRTDIPALYFLDSLWVAKDNEIFKSFTGILDQYSLALQLKADVGGFARITKLMAFGKTGIVAFFNSRIHFFGNLVGANPIDNATQTVLSSAIGCAAPDTAIDVGEDIWFLSERGVFSINQALDNELRANSEPLSKPMNPVFSKINWQQKRNFRAEYWQNQYRIAAALGNSTQNNVIITYSFITKTWHGYHTNAWLDIERLLTLTLARQLQLYSISNDGRISRLYRGFYDKQLDNDDIGIETTMITRGYGSADMDRKRCQRLQIDESDNCPRFSVAVITDGVNEKQVLATDITRDREKYTTFSKGKYVLDNSNDDHGEPYRENYSVKLNGKAFFFPFSFPLSFLSPPADGAVYEICPGQNGIAPDELQRFEYNSIVNRTGDYFQIEIINKKGRQVVHAVRVKFAERNKTTVTRT